MPWPTIDPQFTWPYQLSLYPTVVKTTELSGPPPNLKASRYSKPLNSQNNTVLSKPFGLYQKKQWIDFLLMFTCIWIEKAQRIHPIIYRIEFT